MTVVEKTYKTAQFVTKLLQLTQEKKIEWTAGRSPRGDGRTAFVAEVEEKKLRLYRYQEEVDIYLPGTLILTRSGKTRMVEVTCLEVLDAGLVTYTFEGVSGLQDLYESVAYAASDVDALIDAVLDKN